MVKTVWILFYETWEGEEVVGVYATKKLADEAKTRLKAGWPRSKYNVEEFEVKREGDVPRM